MRLLKNLCFRFFCPKTEFYKYLVQILGFYPENLSFYELAFQHKSVHKQNNERLEFLGDSILDAIISKELYFRFPKKNEGELSKLRSKIVSRSFLNATGKKMGLDIHLKYRLFSIPIQETNLIGNTFESLIGAIYLDGGIDLVERFLKNEIFAKHVNWNEIDTKIVDFKSKVIHFAQKNGKSIDFVVLKGESENRLFEVEIMLDEEKLAQGIGSSKKRAEQNASENALAVLAV